MDDYIMTELEAEALAMERFSGKFKERYLPTLIRFKNPLFNNESPLDWIRRGRIDDVELIYNEIFPDRTIAYPLPKELYVKLKQSYLDKGYRRIPPRIVTEVHKILSELGEDFHEDAITHLYA